MKRSAESIKRNKDLTRKRMSELRKNMTETQKQSALARRRELRVKNKALERFYISNGLSKDDAKELLKIGKIMFCSKTNQFIKVTSTTSKNNADVEQIDNNQNDETKENDSLKNSEGLLRELDEKLNQTDKENEGNVYLNTNMNNVIIGADEYVRLKSLEKRDHIMISYKEYLRLQVLNDPNYILIKNDEYEEFKKTKDLENNGFKLVNDDEYNELQSWKKHFCIEKKSANTQRCEGDVCEENFQKNVERRIIESEDEFEWNNVDQDERTYVNTSTAEKASLPKAVDNQKRSLSLYSSSSYSSPSSSSVTDNRDENSNYLVQLNSDGKSKYFINNEILLIELY